MSKRNYSAFRLSIFFNKGFLFYLEYNLKLFFYLIFKKSDILLSNDLDTICANFFASKLKKNTLIYDSHEIFTEVPELNGRPVVKCIWLLIERFFSKKFKLPTLLAIVFLNTIVKNMVFQCQLFLIFLCLE